MALATSPIGKKVTPSNRRLAPFRSHATSWTSMRRLPAIVVGSTRLVLPMADRSADGLIDAFLPVDDTREASLRDELAGKLAQDPPLLLWAAHHAATGLAGQDKDISPRDGLDLTVADLADWLMENGPTVSRLGRTIRAIVQRCRRRLHTTVKTTVSIRKYGPSACPRRWQWASRLAVGRGKRIRTDLSRLILSAYCMWPNNGLQKLYPSR